MNHPKNGKRLTYEYVKKYIESEGYKLLSDSYKNTNTKIKVQCPKGHKYEVTYHSFKRGYRCSICAGVKKHSYEYIKNNIEKEGYTLLSDTYKNANTKIKVKCLEGHEYEVTFNNFQHGKRCSKCKGTEKLTYDFVKKYIESEGYKLLSNSYKNNSTYLKIKCLKGHQYKTTFGNFQQGNRCSKCKGVKRLTYEYVKKQIEDEGYTLLSNTYKNAQTKIKVQCPKSHKYKVTYGNFQQGKRCPICAIELTTSKGEKEVTEFVKAQGIDIIENDRSQILNPLTNKNLELDIWIPSMKKAIEYNGTYWHSFKDAIKHDEIKKQQCEKLGIDLLIIEENNWQNNQLIEKQIIRNFLNG